MMTRSRFRPRGQADEERRRLEEELAGLEDELDDEEEEEEEEEEDLEDDGELSGVVVGGWVGVAVGVDPTVAGLG